MSYSGTVRPFWLNFWPEGILLTLTKSLVIIHHSRLIIWPVSWPRTWKEYDWRTDDKEDLGWNMVINFAEWMSRIIWMKWTTLWMKLSLLFQAQWLFSGLMNEMAVMTRLELCMGSPSHCWVFSLLAADTSPEGVIDLVLQEDQSTTWRQVNFIGPPHHWGNDTCLSFLKYTYFKFKYACLTEDLVMVLSGKQPFLMLCYRMKCMLWASVQYLALFFLVTYFCITTLKQLFKTYSNLLCLQICDL